MDAEQLKSQIEQLNTKQNALLKELKPHLDQFTAATQAFLGQWYEEKFDKLKSDLTKTQRLGADGIRTFTQKFNELVGITQNSAAENLPKLRFWEESYQIGGLFDRNTTYLVNELPEPVDHYIRKYFLGPMGNLLRSYSLEPEEHRGSQWESGRDVGSTPKFNGSYIPSPAMLDSLKSYANKCQVVVNLKKQKKQLEQELDKLQSQALWK